MPKDYYAILGISKNATDVEIKKAYRKLALEWHPDKHKEGADKDLAKNKFIEISEAYEVLNDQEKRNVYDNYGESGLKNGTSTGNPFHFSQQDADRLFNMFFPGGVGGVSTIFMGTPLNMAFGMSSGNPLSNMFTNRNMFTNHKDPPVYYDLFFSLEELYRGTTKNLKVTRSEFDQTNGSYKRVTENIKIDIQPGWKEDTKITYQQFGDKYPGKVPADVVIVVKEKPNKYFKRDGNDLIYKKSISLKEALTGCVFDVVTIDGEKIQIDCSNDLIHPGNVKILENKGMPVVGKPNLFGNLIVEFVVQFPTYLSPQQRINLKKIL